MRDVRLVATTDQTLMAPAAPETGPMQLALPLPPIPAPRADPVAARRVAAPACRSPRQRLVQPQRALSRRRREALAWCEPEDGTLRAAIHAPVVLPKAPTAQRLTAHGLNLALMVVAMPIGAAMTAQALLKGENLYLSARTAAVTGIALPGLKLAFGLMTGNMQI